MRRDQTPNIADDLTSGEQPIVFVVDDDESMRRALTNLFQSVGLRVEVFGSAPNCCGVSYHMLQAVWSSTSGCLD
jgi:FixJ family two-component response regulator